MSEVKDYNDDLTKRQAQINEWAYNNKMDTLFVFQLIFISLLFVGVLMSLKQTGVVGAGFVWYSMAILLIIVVIVIVNRSMYTNTKRDSKFWNRRHFNGDNNMSSPMGVGDSSYLSYIDSIRAAFPPPTTSDSSTTSGTRNCCKC
jgi:amino acid permease